MTKFQKFCIAFIMGTEDVLWQYVIDEEDRGKRLEYVDEIIRKRIALLKHYELKKEDK